MPLSIAANAVLKEIGLDRWPDFIGDRLFIAAILIAAAVWGVLWFTLLPGYTLEGRSIALIVFTGIIWSPILEEILFRGVVQGFLLKKTWGSTKFFFLSKANWLSSLLFVLAHLWYQPVIWAIMVFAPSLVFGFFRDRYNNTYPCILLHAIYNGGFIWANYLKQ